MDTLKYSKKFKLDVAFFKHICKVDSTRKLMAGKRVQKRWKGNE
jgi:hypothetical protein